MKRFNFYWVSDNLSRPMEIQLLFCLMEGQDENLHFGKVTSELLLITVFGNDVSLGFLRIKIAELIDRILRLW